MKTTFKFFLLALAFVYLATDGSTMMGAIINDYASTGINNWLLGALVFLLLDAIIFILLFSFGMYPFLRKHTDE